MSVVNMLDAKTRLSQLVDAVESGAEDEVVIARNGRPAVKLVRLDAKPNRPVKLGLAKGLYPPMGDPFALDAEIEAMFLGEPGDR